MKGRLFAKVSLIVLALFATMYVSTGDLFLSFVFSIGFYGAVAFIYYIAYRYWLKPLLAMSKSGGYWVPKLFWFYLVNGIYVVYHMYRRDGGASGFTILFAAGTLALLYEMASHAKSGRTMIDLLKFSSDRLKLEKGSGYYDLGLCFVIVFWAVVMLAFNDGIILFQFAIDLLPRILG